MIPVIIIPWVPEMPMSPIMLLFRFNSQNSSSTFVWLFSTFSALLHCVFSNVSLNCLQKRMHNHTGCICLTFLHCASSNVSSNCLHKRRHNHTGCICLTSLHCAFSYVSSNRLPDGMQNHTCCIV